LQTAPPTLARLLENKVVVDPSNPLGFDESGQMIRTLPDGLSAGSVVAALLPAGAHYVKAFGTLAADALASAANRERQQAVLFYATDDDTAATTIERLTRAAGFEPLKAGTVERDYTPIRDEGVDESGPSCRGCRGSAAAGRAGRHRHRRRGTHTRAHSRP
jgi:predicted dinucleotide-binding enzyme